MLVTLVLTFACILTPVRPVRDQGVDCKVEAESCVTSQNNVTRTKIKDFYFIAGCRSYREGLDCVDSLFADADTCDPYVYSNTFRRVKEMLFSASGGLCGLDGSISGCAYDFNNCFAKIGDVEKALAQNIPDNACRAFIRFNECVQLIMLRMHCPFWVEDNLLDRVTQLEEKLTFDCFKTCDMALDICIAHVSENINNTKMTDADHENVCVELEAAISCINTSSVEKICNRDNETSLWRQTLNTLNASEHELCSTPAGICFYELEECSNALTYDDYRLLSTGDIIKLCNKVDIALDCVNRTSLSPICTKEKDPARKRVAELSDQRAQMATFCDAANCSLNFPQCLDTLHQVQFKVEDAPKKLVCEEVKKALECAHSMKNFKPCHVKEYGNFTFENTVAVLTGFEASLCDSLRTHDTDCTLYHQCFLALTTVTREPPSCKRSLWRKECAENLTESCLPSKHSQTFAYVQKTESLFLSKYCSSAQTLHQKFTVLMLLTLLKFWILDKR